MVARSPRSCSTRRRSGPATWPGAKPWGTSSSCSLPFASRLTNAWATARVARLDGRLRRLHAAFRGRHADRAAGLGSLARQVSGVGRLRLATLDLVELEVVGGGLR